jgi:tetratricopeptide (TPR) repeat protein
MSRDLDGAESYHRRALEIRRALGDEERIGNSLTGLGTTLLERASREAIGCILEAIGVWERLGHTANLSRELSNLGAAHRHLGELDAAEVALERATAVETSLNGRPDVATVNNLGTVRYQRGDYRGARDAYVDALGFSEAAANRRYGAMLRLNAAEAEIRLGEYDGAARHVAEAVSLLSELDGSDYLLSYLWFLDGERLAATGQAAGARDAYRRSLTLALSCGDADRESEARSRLEALERDRLAGTGFPPQHHSGHIQREGRSNRLYSSANPVVSSLRTDVDTRDGIWRKVRPDVK